MPTADALEMGRDAFARRAWDDAFAHLSAADRVRPLEPDDVERLATAAYMTARDAESADAWTRAHHAHQERGDVVRAARAAFWLGFQLMPKGDFARAGGWLARAKRLLDEGGHDCPEQGLVMVPLAAQTMFGGDAAGALALFEQAAEIGRRFKEPDLLTLSAFGRGQALIALGRIPEGVAVFDEAMVAVTAGEVSVFVAGLVYCGVIAGCYELFDIGRAREWTAALSAWCETQPDLVPFRGQCLVHRAQIMQLGGAWAEALEEAERARARLSAPPLPAIGLAFYQLGELHRLRGAFDKAEDAYRQAGEAGRSPQPGLALLRLAQGRPDAAQAGVRRALEETREPAPRSRILPAAVEIALTLGDLALASSAADELASLAEQIGAPYVGALAAHARGAVLVASGEPAAALPLLRRASATWQELEAPYEMARTRLLVAEACRALGDDDGATLEIDAARRALELLGAAPDLARFEPPTRAAGGLTPREAEVLALVAQGKTNREIAKDLVISEKTVERHVSNIFTKLGLQTRAAATAYAYEHGLV